MREAFRKYLGNLEFPRRGLIRVDDFDQALIALRTTMDSIGFRPTTVGGRIAAMDAEQIWREKSDEDLVDACQRLSEFTPQGEAIIRAEARRRGLPAPPDPVDYCQNCGRGLYAEQAADACMNCGEPLPRSVGDLLAAPDDDPIVTEVVYRSRFGHEINLVIEALEQADIAAVPGLTTPYGGDFPLARGVGADLQGTGDESRWYVVRVASDDIERALAIISGLPVSDGDDERDEPTTDDPPDAPAT